MLLSDLTPLTNLVILNTRKLFSDSGEWRSQFSGLLLHHAALPTLFSHSSSDEVK